MKSFFEKTMQVVEPSIEVLEIPWVKIATESCDQKATKKIENYQHYRDVTEATNSSIKTDYKRGSYASIEI